MIHSLCLYINFLLSVTKHVKVLNLKKKKDDLLTICSYQAFNSEN